MAFELRRAEVYEWDRMGWNFASADNVEKTINWDCLLLWEDMLQQEWSVAGVTP